MGELLNFSPNGEPFLRFNSQLGQINATRGNSTLFLHDFENAGADHLFVTTSEDEDNYQGAFLWRVLMNHSDPEFFDRLSSELQENDWDTLICDQVAEGDQRVFDKFVESQVAKITTKKIYKWLGDLAV